MATNKARLRRIDQAVKLAQGRRLIILAETSGTATIDGVAVAYDQGEQAAACAGENDTVLRVCWEANESAKGDDIIRLKWPGEA